SPRAWPPIPSMTRKRPNSSSETGRSSFRERFRPGLVFTPASTRMAYLGAPWGPTIITLPRSLRSQGCADAFEQLAARGCGVLAGEPGGKFDEGQGTGLGVERLARRRFALPPEVGADDHHFGPGCGQKRQRVGQIRRRDDDEAGLPEHLTDVGQDVGGLLHAEDVVPGPGRALARREVVEPGDGVGL